MVICILSYSTTPTLQVTHFPINQSSFRDISHKCNSNSVYSLRFDRMDKELPLEMELIQLSKFYHQTSRLRDANDVCTTDRPLNRHKN